MNFKSFNKIPRLTKDCTITEKIDGSNVQVYIVPKENLTSSLYLDENSYISEEFKEEFCLGENEDSLMFAGSRKRWLTTEKDNYGFAKWVKANNEELFKLGEGRHFGEWWGCGIQRKYEQKEKRFSLFNVGRWHEIGEQPRLVSTDPRTGEETYTKEAPNCCYVVPILYQGEFNTLDVDYCMHNLKMSGSEAVPGFMNPEGIVIYHKASGQLFKKTFDDNHKESK